MAAPESPIPLSAVGLRLADEVGQRVLDWVASGDLSASAELDQHVAAIRTVLAGCQPADPAAARLAGQEAARAARSGLARSDSERSDTRRSDTRRSDSERSGTGQADSERSDTGQAGSQRSGTGRSGAPRSGAPRPHHARRSGAAASLAPATASCPDLPFADSPWYTDDIPPLRLLLHYACGFVEAAVRADWWPGETATTATGAADFEAMRLAAVCRLIRQAETAATLPPGLR